ncbi:hypothetical protein [Clostridium intestinale]|uniref:hypothetical protein n=1 Tax=Clostridium intestinale TaxID=36845 RepID=UPI002DD63798|nr:hypothetical protein [Clostridium intestinale]WRY52142.1 hypothetical protein P8F83_02880 [Clostridium intestinale]
MKKTLFLIISITFLLMLSGCRNINSVFLRGSYQSERTSDRHFVQISIYSDENSFVEYIDNREVNKGTFDIIEGKKYSLVGDKQTIEINLDKNNSFEITMKKVNDGNPILMKNLGDLPAKFDSRFNDTEEYEKLLE